MIEILLIGLPIVAVWLYIGVKKNDRKIERSQKRLRQLENELSGLLRKE